MNFELGYENGSLKMINTKTRLKEEGIFQETYKSYLTKRFKIAKLIPKYWSHTLYSPDSGLKNKYSSVIFQCLVNKLFRMFLTIRYSFSSKRDILYEHFVLFFELVQSVAVENTKWLKTTSNKNKHRK